MNEIIVTCRACGEQIVLQSNVKAQDLTVLAVHSECAIIYAKAA